MPVGKMNRDRVRQTASDERELRNSNTFLKLKDGKNRIRLLPPPPGSDDVFFKTATHWGVGPNNRNLNAPVDEKGRVGGWLREKAFALKNSDNKEDQKLGEAIRPKNQWLYNVVDLDNLDAGLQVLAVGIKTHEQFLAYLEDEDDDYGDVTDLDEGYDLTITKKGVKRNTDYKVKAKKNASPIPDEIRELLETEDPTDLSTVRPISTDEEMKAAFYGEDEEDAEEADEEETPSITRRRAKAATPAAKADDDDDDDDDDSDEDDDDDSDEDDDDEDDDDEDEEDADEAPPAKPEKAGRKPLGRKITSRRAAKK